jgi:hypothetical protein
VVGRAWPRRPDLIQPARGGVSRRAFWMPAHVAFELALVLALAVTWSEPEIRSWLLVGLAIHATMWIWSALDFHPECRCLRARRSGDGRRSCRAQVDAPKRLAPAVGRRDLRGDAGRLCRGGAARLRDSGTIRACWIRRRIGAAQIIADVAGRNHTKQSVDSRELAMKRGNRSTACAPSRLR